MISIFVDDLESTFDRKRRITEESNAVISIRRSRVKVFAEMSDFKFLKVTGSGPIDEQDE